MVDSKMKSEVEIPKGTTVHVDAGFIHVKGPKGELKRKLLDKTVKTKQEGSELVIYYDEDSKREKKKLYTLAAHVRNMMKGVNEGFTYTLKICSGHFPMTVTTKGDSFEIKNFIGEAVPRRIKLLSGVKVKIEADIITVEAADKEIAGQTAASIEKLTRRPGFDKRIFQDGIYITDKDGKKMGH
jgi:large subunit ribosomal protein L6